MRNEQSLLPRTVSATWPGRRARVSSEQYFTGTAFRDAFSRRDVGVPTSRTPEDELFDDLRAVQRAEKSYVEVWSGLTEAPYPTWRPTPAMIRGMSAVGSQADGNRGHFGLLYRNPGDCGQARLQDSEGDP